MSNFMKESKTVEQMLPTDDTLQGSFYKKSRCNGSIVKIGIATAVVLMLFSAGLYKKIGLADVEQGEHLTLVNVPIAATIAKKNIISIPTGIVKANPFVPYRSLGDESSASSMPVEEVPKFDLVAPPETLGEHSEGAKIMDTVVSGILYDKFSPSAILNIDGNDYLVKKGDTVNNYTVLAITQNSVTVKYGKNTYKAGIGEVLSDGTLNYNEVSNLNKKFGGR